MELEIENRALKKEYGINKAIPRKYEKEILIALSHYPQLKNTAIHFKLALRASVPYGTKPTLTSCFKTKKYRTYIITILEAATYPESKVLLKELTENMRIGVIGHELAHVKQYEGCNPISMIKTVTSYLIPAFRRKLERNADRTAIKHGLGEELLEHALYIRSVPGYIKKRPKINEDYLQPTEIEYYIKHPDEIIAA